MQGFRQFSAHSSHSLDSNRQQLERLWNAPATAEAGPLTRWLKTTGQLLCDFFTGTQQLRIWTQSTKAGTLWHAYDSDSQRSFIAHSEQEMRVWLERRYRA